METPEKNNRDQSRSENEKGGKKPYFKHYRHKNHHKNNGDNNKISYGGADNINVSRPRYDVPPTEADKAAAPTVKEGEGRRHEQSGHHRNDRHRRRHGRHHHAGENKAVENSPVNSAISDGGEAAVSEYITTAGSLDAEIIDELNSVSAAEAKNMEYEPETYEIPDTPEVELAKYEIVGIRFKAGGKIYYFDPAGHKITRGENVVVETSRGPEYGVCDIPNRTVTEREVVLPLRPVMRIATAEDTARHEVNCAKEQEALSICAQKILDHKLGMKLIDVEYAFDGSKLLFYFTAEGRVDFRELVKDLAAVFRTRIELRQIGIRDETKLLGGIGICGRPFCCKSFLSDFVQVSIKMAKEQNLSLNSAKISGACGRLMCCLRYEYDVYQEEIKKTPKVDQIVSTPDGEGTVIEVQPLAGLVRVRFGSKADMIVPKVYHRDEVTVIGGKGVKPKE